MLKHLRVPMEITYFNAHGEQLTISRIVDFYVKGLIDITIYDVEVIELSGKPTIIGEIINEGNENALFGFVTLEPLGNSNIKKQTQYIDEIELILLFHLTFQLNLMVNQNMENMTSESL